MMVITKSHPRLPGSERLGAWLGLLALAQSCDVLTTQVDMARGGVEANHLAALLLASGGLWLLWAVKFSLVAAMGGAVLLVHRCWRREAGRGAALAHAAVWRGLQVSVVMLVLISAHNVAVLTALVGLF